MGRAQDAERLLHWMITVGRWADRGDAEQDAELLGVVTEMVAQLGPSIPKRVVARAAGCAVSTLDRHIAQGHLAVLTRPGSSRQEIRTDHAVALVTPMTSTRWRSRTALADAYKPVIKPTLVLHGDMDTFSLDAMRDAELLHEDSSAGWSGTPDAHASQWDDPDA